VMAVAPVDLLVCPVCRSDLVEVESGSRCSSCARKFNGDPLDLTPLPPPDEELAGQWGLWERLQANFLVAATAVPGDSLSVTERPDASAFARFCAMTGTVLDIGCGTQALPTYADVTACRFVGVDPLPGERERQFEFVQCLGEYLPFRTASVDQALFATSLDHMLIPSRAIQEAARVIRPGGAVSIWFGEVDRPYVPPPPPNLLTRVRSRAAQTLRSAPPPPDPGEPEYLTRLDQPDGAIDKFHVAHPTAETTSEWLTAAGLAAIEIERIDYGNGCFIRGHRPSA
jgi:SAM-dependent methyltransferase